MLFILLVAIAILGGLAAMMARSGSSSDDTGSAEQNSIAASDLIKYVSGIRTAVDGLRARGCGENTISFENTDPRSLVYTNSQTPSDGSCMIFSPAGAGLKFKGLPTGQYITGQLGDGGPIFWRALAVNGAGTNANDLVVIYNSLTKDMCVAVNKILGVSSSDPPVAETYTNTVGSGQFQGTYLTPPSGDPAGDIAPYAGRKEFCMLNGTFYQFVAVLIAR